LKFTFTGKHEVDKQNAYQVKEYDLDRFPEPDDAFNPVHEVKLGVLFNF
jgi:hypothetical protein